MEKKLEDLGWKPKWVSHLGCIKGCLDYLDLDVSDAWLFGATGHAFVLNIHDELCPSGPTAWRTDMLFKLGNNIGYAIDGVVAFKSDGDFAEKQRLAWEHTKRAIDQGLPCYGWELDIPEYYVVNGYDDEGYHFSGPGCDSGKGPKPWEELGDTEIGLVEMYSVRPGTAADDITTVKEAFGLVLEHSTSPAEWIYPLYKAGLAGFDNWIQAVESRKAGGFGMAYNAAVWSECRDLAVAFLREAKDRLGAEWAGLFDEAIGHYEVVAVSLRAITHAFPFHGLKPEHIEDESRLGRAAEQLKRAREAEAFGLKVLERIATEL